MKVAARDTSATAALATPTAKTERGAFASALDDASRASTASADGPSDDAKGDGAPATTTRAHRQTKPTRPTPKAATVPFSISQSLLPVPPPPSATTTGPAAKTATSSTGVDASIDPDAPASSAAAAAGAKPAADATTADAKATDGVNAPPATDPSAVTADPSAAATTPLATATLSLAAPSAPSLPADATTTQPTPATVAAAPTTPPAATTTDTASASTPTPTPTGAPSSSTSSTPIESAVASLTGDHRAPSRLDAASLTSRRRGRTGDDDDDASDATTSLAPSTATSRTELRDALTAPTATNTEARLADAATQATGNAAAAHDALALAHGRAHLVVGEDSERVVVSIAMHGTNVDVNLRAGGDHLAAAVAASMDQLDDALRRQGLSLGQLTTATGDGAPSRDQYARHSHSSHAPDSSGEPDEPPTLDPRLRALA